MLGERAHEHPHLPPGTSRADVSLGLTLRLVPCFSMTPSCDVREVLCCSCTPCLYFLFFLKSILK